MTVLSTAELALYFAYADTHMHCRLCHCGLGSRKDLEHIAVLLSGPRHLTREVSQKQTMCARRTRCQRLLEERDLLQAQQVHIVLLLFFGYCAHACRGCLPVRVPVLCCSQLEKLGQRWQHATMHAPTPPCCAVGAGILALPAVTHSTGFGPTSGLLLACWAVLQLEALLLVVRPHSPLPCTGIKRGISKYYSSLPHVRSP